MKNYDIEKVKSQTKFFDDGFVCCFGLIYETEFLDEFFFWKTYKELLNALLLMLLQNLKLKEKEKS